MKKSLEKSCLVLLFIFLITIHIKSVNAQEMEANNPLPNKFISSSSSIWLNKEVYFENPTILISAPVPGPAIIMYGAAYSQQEIKQQDIANSVAFKNDSAILAMAAYNKFTEAMKSANIPLVTEKEKADFILNINIYDHGFHWATSSAAGIYARIQAELVSKEGKLLWTQLYHLTKAEAKVPYNRKAMMFNKAVDKILVDFENNPNLLPETYEIICGFLAANIIPE